MGVDIGGGVGADRSVVVVRNRKQVLAVFASEWHGVLDDARHRLEPIVVELARKWGVAPDRIVYDKAGIGRSFGSYLASYGLAGAVGYFGAGKGGKLYVNRRTANAFALRRRLDPHRENHVPFYCGGIPEWPALRQELAELRSPTMEIEEGAGQAGPRRQGGPRRPAPPLARLARCALDDVQLPPRGLRAARRGGKPSERLAGAGRRMNTSLPVLVDPYNPR